MKGANRYKNVLNLEKIGVCGVPTLWKPFENLAREGVIPKEVLQEERRV